MQLYWNHTSSWVISSKVVAFLQNTFSEEHLWRAASGDLHYNKKQTISSFVSLHSYNSSTPVQRFSPLLPSFTPPVPRILLIPIIPILILIIPNYSSYSDPDSPHFHPDFSHSHHSHPDFPHSHHFPDSVSWFHIPAFTDSFLSYRDRYKGTYIPTVI